MKTKIFIIILLAVLLIIFVMQNTAIVIIKYLFWELSLPRALLLFINFAMGLIVGLIIPSSQKKGEQEEK